MKLTIQYIPLNRIHSSKPVRMTERIKQLRRVLWDSAHLLAVKKNRKDGTFVVVGGHDRLRYLRSNTNKQYAPCILDEANDSVSRNIPVWIRDLRNRKLPKSFPAVDPDKITPAGWSIVRSFVKEEPRFETLTRVQKLRVLLLAVRYKRTVVLAMKRMVDELTEERTS